MISVLAAVAVIIRYPNMVDPIKTRTHQQATDILENSPDVLHDLYRQLRTDPNSIDIKTELKSRWLYYNRMTKTGSRTLTQIIGEVSSLKQYTDFHLGKQIFNTTRASERERVSSVLSKSPPFLVTGDHMHINYTKYGVNQPISFSLIRDPIDRFISQFYWIRNGDDKGHTSPNQPSEEQRKMSLDECVGMAVSENSADPPIKKYCRAELNQQTKRFCGYDGRCRNPDFALYKASDNLDDYLVIGLYEQNEDFVAVLEYLLPHLYPGMLELYRKETAAYHAQYKTSKKVTPKNETMQILKTAARREYIFYEKVKERFRKLHSVLETSASTGGGTI